MTALPTPSKTFARLPIQPCSRCGASGWNPDNPDELCGMCHGYRGAINLPWAKPKPTRLQGRLSPERVHTLRNLGEFSIELENYPKEGTPEWEAFVAEAKARTTSRIAAMKEALAARNFDGKKWKTVHVGEAKA